MKTLVLANQKGGVGKSAVAVQLGYYLAEQRKLRVVVVDLDHQRNTSKALRVGGIATVSAVTSGQLLSTEKIAIEEAPFLLVGGDDSLIKLEKQAKEHNRFATNLRDWVRSLQDRFDVAIFDTNPNPDIRQLAALIAADYVLSPLQLNQEAIDGIGDLLNHANIGIRKIQATLNPRLRLIGILPNLVEPTPFQRENFRDLSLHYAKLLIPHAGGYAAIKRTTAIPEAQSAGLPIWKGGKTSSREAWASIKPVFETLAKAMGLSDGD